MSKEESAAAEGAKVSEAKDEAIASQDASDKEIVAMSKALLKKDNKIADL